MELRTALIRIAPEAVATFDAECAEAAIRARLETSSAPMRRFLRQWALHVAIERYPDTADRLRRLEAEAASVDSVEEGRMIATEIGRILGTAAAEAGVPCGGEF
ncbi:hypothetical protein ACIRP0_36570 [Streptomyces sp. NPDC101733]|uniref:hypothetical protein n=1 Tax=unclassified Streptomyces TaxID=2593676 RepID=UPI003827A71A